MTISEFQTAAFPQRSTHTSGWLNFIELLYTGYLWFSMFSVSLGIDIPLMGAAWLITLVFLCVPLVNWKGMQAKLIYFVAAISGTHILTQVFYYQQSYTNGYVINYFWWVASITVISTLMQRPSFIKRLAVQMLLIALIWSPFVVIEQEAGVERANLSVGNVISNSNAYAAWLGYCILVLWQWSLKTSGRFKTLFLRSTASVALIFAVRTISRGFVISVGLAFLSSLRSVKFSRTVVILLVVAIIGFVLVSYLPATQQIWQSYSLRFPQESSRWEVARIALQAIADEPLLGYGVHRIRMYLPITPHNELILLWFTSGIVPTALYIIFLIYLVRLALLYERVEQFINPLPLILYTIIQVPTTNIVLPNLWAVCSVCYLFSLGDSLTVDQNPKKEDEKIIHKLPVNVLHSHQVG